MNMTCEESYAPLLFPAGGRKIILDGGLVAIIQIMRIRLDYRKERKASTSEIVRRQE